MRGIVFAVSLAILIGATLLLAYGLSFGSPMESKMDDYFIHNAQNETGSNNVVTSVVFDYRGLDTLGEATVLFTAVTGVGVLLGRRSR